MSIPLDIPLHGTWTRAIGGHDFESVMVPGTWPACGTCRVHRTFVLPAGTLGEDDVIALVGEGILAAATFFLNGHELGRVGPWNGFRLPIPPGLLCAAGSNEIAAEVTDISEIFGPTPGRHFRPGLFRPLRLERRPRTRITEVHPRIELASGLERATVKVVVELEGPDHPELICVLRERGGRVIARATGRAGSLLCLIVEHPRLWSPESPSLYELEVHAGEDHWMDFTGFRHLAVQGPDLILNGERLVLAGVCRHEFVGTHGYAAPEAVVRHELARIRHAGFNHVRLVHSPQAAWVPRLAAELGLLVSEEPGACFHDLADPRVANGAVAALEGLVRRDRHLPSIFAWYIYNECLPNTSYAVRAVAACRALDPGCLTGMADCSGQVDAIKTMVASSNLSLYGINVYSPSTGDYQRVLDAYPDRPVVLTEWGGCIAQGNRRLLRDHLSWMEESMRPVTPRRLAGASFWAWADYEERSRAPTAAVDGWTIEGLVDRHGQAKEDLADLSQWCFALRHPRPTLPIEPQILRPAVARAGWQALDLEAVTGDQSKTEARLRTVLHGEPTPGRMPVCDHILVDGVPFAPRGGGRGWMPLLLGLGRTHAVIPVDRRIRALAVLGSVAFSAAYPTNDMSSVHHRDAEPHRALGDLAGSWDLEYADGTVELPLRHGIEVLRGSDICRWWQAGPRSPATVPALRLVVHESYCLLRFDLWEHPVDPDRKLRAIHWRLADSEAVLALLGLAVLPVGEPYPSDAPSTPHAPAS